MDSESAGTMELFGAVWRYALACGHEGMSDYEPRVSGWVTCSSLECQSQRRIVRVWQTIRGEQG